MSKSETIEINGRQYDTASGAVLPKSKDDSKSSVSTDAALPPTISEDNDVVVSKGSKRAGHHKVAKSAAAHKRQKAKTLVRHAVKKPSFRKEERRLGKVSSAIASSLQTETGGKGFMVKDMSDRAVRAGQISKSAAVHKFNDLIKPDQNVEKIEVKRSTPEPTKTFNPDILPAKPAEKVNPFDTAVERSNSHEETLPRPPLFSFSRLSGQFLVMAISFVVVSAVVLDMQSQSLAINLAAYSAHVTASVPSYVPQGYSIQDPIYHNSEKLIINYSNGANTIQLTESNTALDSTELLAFDVSQSDNPYTSVTANGQPVFIFSNGSAVWTLNGVLYQLSSTTQLSNVEIQNIATSVV